MQAAHELLTLCSLKQCPDQAAGGLLLLQDGGERGDGGDEEVVGLVMRLPCAGRQAVCAMGAPRVASGRCVGWAIAGPAFGRQAVVLEDLRQAWLAWAGGLCAEAAARRTGLQVSWELQQLFSLKLCSSGLCGTPACNRIRSVHQAGGDVRRVKDMQRLFAFSVLHDVLTTTNACMRLDGV
jgi:hypothetical protein